MAGVGEMFTVTMETPKFSVSSEGDGQRRVASSVLTESAQERCSLPECPSLPSAFNQL